MVRTRSSVSNSQLRDDLFALLNNRNVSMEKALEALSQCQAQITNRVLVERTAKECGLRLSQFLTNAELELYYDIKQGRGDVGFISKGWDDPGFRVGDIFTVPKHNLPQLNDNIVKLLKFCATRGVSVTVDDTQDGVEVQMDSVIYTDGFNKKVFEQVLQCLNVCIDKAGELIG